MEIGSSTGPHDIALGRRPAITIGWGENPFLRTGIWQQFGHLAFLVDDLESVVRTVESNGWWYRRSRPEMKSKYIFIKDPNGYDIEILEARQPS